MALVNMDGEGFGGNQDKDVVEGNYFIIDWLGNDAMRPSRRNPRMVVSNATEEELQNIKDKHTVIPRPGAGGKQRLILKVIEVEDIDTGNPSLPKEEKKPEEKKEEKKSEETK